MNTTSFKQVTSGHSFGMVNALSTGAAIAAAGVSVGSLSTCVALAAGVGIATPSLDLAARLRSRGHLQHASTYSLPTRSAPPLSFAGMNGTFEFGSGCDFGIDRGYWHQTESTLPDGAHTVIVAESAESVAEQLPLSLTRWTVESFRDQYEFALESRWDGEQAVAITNEVIALASKLFAEQAPLPPPSEVAPLIEGALSFVWDSEKGYLFVSVGPQRFLHVYYDVPSLGTWERITSIENRFAKSHLARAISALTGHAAAVRPQLELIAV